MTRGPAAALVGLVLLAAGLRFAATGLTHAAAAPADENRLIAANLAAGRGFTFTEFGRAGPTAVRGPAYPMLLALLGPDRVGLALAVNAAAGALGVGAAFALARRLATAGDGRTDRTRTHAADRPTARRTAPREEARVPRAAWAAAAGFAVWPTQLYAATLTQGLAVAVALTLAALALLLRRTPGAVVAGGLLAGLAVLFEPSLSPALALAAVAAGWRRHRAGAAGFVAAATVLVAPWLYRNAVVFGGPMPLTSNAWRDAFLGNGDDATGSRDIGDTPAVPDAHYRTKSVTRIDRLPPAEYDRLKVPEARRTDFFRDRAWSWVRAHPAPYLKLCVVRAAETFFLDPTHPASAYQIYAVPRFLLALASLCAVCGLGPRPGRGLVVALMAGVVAAGAFTVTGPRLSPLMDVPQLLAVAAYCADRKSS